MSVLEDVNELDNDSLLAVAMSLNAVPVQPSTSSSQHTTTIASQKSSSTIAQDKQAFNFSQTSSSTPNDNIKLPSDVREELVNSLCEVTGVDGSTATYLLEVL